MVSVEIDKIELRRREMVFDGMSKSVVTRMAPEITLSIAIRSETAHWAGEARLTETERDAFLTLLTAIEERLADEITRQ